ncbi:MAG TPA: RIP metalloprotease RseP [Candidatus Omnitrophota bacterium]|nr:RIP metalloprotease RseP [Candidatus Omnitrophota bacterium]
MEQVIANIQSIVIFIVVLSVLIIVHEWGHFITAKKLGVKVERFSVGFGPKLFSRMHNDTEFLVCAVPLGGYVKMAGDERSQCKGTSEEFYSKSPGHRSLIVFNGPLVNFFLAYFCLVIVFMLGFPDLSNKVGELIEDYPAQQAGVQVGDQILKVDGQAVESWSDVQKLISESQSSTLELDVLREAQPLKISVVPKVVERKNIFGQLKTVRMVGISPAEEIIALKCGFFESFGKAYDKLVEITVMTYKAIYFMLTGSMSPKESMTGPIGIFYIIKSAAEMGMAHLLLIVGVISASLAIFNLLPVVPLDGGHLFLLAVEKVRGKALPPRIDEYVARFGFSLIILLAIYVFYSDFARFGWIDKIKGIF